MRSFSKLVEQLKNTGGKKYKKLENVIEEVNSEIINITEDKDGLVIVLNECFLMLYSNYVGISFDVATVPNHIIKLYLRLREVFVNFGYKDLELLNPCYSDGDELYLGSKALEKFNKDISNQAIQDYQMYEFLHKFESDIEH